MSGITFFINQQARYRNFDNVYAAIMMIGIIGLTTDMLLAWFGKVLFPWKRRGREVKQAPLSVFAGGGIALVGSPHQSHQASLLGNFDKLESPEVREAGVTPLQP
jgi:hypothetical protein